MTLISHRELAEDASEKAAEPDLARYRRSLQRLHDALRDEGFDPVGAVRVVARLLTHDQEALGLASERVRTLAKDAARRTGPSGAIWLAFQQFLSAQARYGLGQYLTPPPVAELMREVSRGRDLSTVLDPFLGTGILLEIAAEAHPEARFQGIEVNATIADIAKAVADLTGTPLAVERADSFRLWADGELGQVDAVLTNPPYGSTTTALTAEDLKALKVPGFLSTLSPLPAELLGLELAISVLRPGGFLGIVLPQSFLTNSRWNPYRMTVFRRLEPLSVVALPEETFAPFGGVARACVLFGVRRDSVDLARIPYFKSRSVGYDGRGRPSGVSDLLQLAEPTESLGHFLREMPGGELKHTSSEDSHKTDVVMLGTIADVFTGRTPPSSTYEPTGPIVLKVGDLSSSFVSWRPRLENRANPDYLARQPRLSLRSGDICLTAAAHKPRYIGLKVNLLDMVPPEGAIASSEVLVIRLREGSVIRPPCLLAFLRSTEGYDQLQAMIRGSTAHLYARDVSELTIPLLHLLPDADQQVETFKLAAAAYRQFQRLEDAWIAVSET